MLLTNNEIYSLYEGLSKITQNKELKIPVKTSFYLLKNMKEIQGAYESLMDLRKEIILKYADQDGENYTIPAEKIEAANAELMELLSIENEFNIMKIKLSDIEALELSLEETASIMGIIEEE